MSEISLLGELFIQMTSIALGNEKEGEQKASAWTPKRTQPHIRVTPMFKNPVFGRPISGEYDSGKNKSYGAFVDALHCLFQLLGTCRQILCWSSPLDALVAWHWLVAQITVLPACYSNIFNDGEGPKEHTLYTIASVLLLQVLLGHIKTMSSVGLPFKTSLFCFFCATILPSNPPPFSFSCQSKCRILPFLGTNAHLAGAKADEVLHIATRFFTVPNEYSGFLRVLQQSRGHWLTAGAWSPGCSLPGILGCGEAYKNPGRGPGSPPPPKASGPGFAASQTTDGCGFSSHVRCGSSHRRAWCCDARWVNGPPLCGCCFGFFGPV